MRHIKDTLHVTEQRTLSLPVEVEIETADSRMENGQRFYSVEFFTNTQLISRNTGCGLERLRYRFYEAKETTTCELLDPWECRGEFLCENVALRKCNAGLKAKKQGRGKTASLIAVRPADNPTHSWALGPDGSIGNYILTNQGDWLFTETELLFSQECSRWRALIGDALVLDYAKWEQLKKKHPATWVHQLFMPLPLTVESREGAAIARVVCQSLLDVLIVTTQLDGIRGLRQRICKADGCGKFFPTGNYEHKIYCSYECAHRQAVRDGRKRKREAIERATKNSKKLARNRREKK